jgi:hypothetical protein
MNTLTETYRTYRRHLTVPAAQSLRQVRAQAHLAARVAATGFAWQENRRGHPCALWHEDDFDLCARFVDDTDGWWSCGVETFDKFIARWELGAIRHRKVARQECEWFLPAHPEYGHEDYRRACAYGRTWWYVGVVVEASRAGIVLGEKSLWGIDYEPDGEDGYLTETAFELAEEAIVEARQKLKELCGCH